MSWPSLSSSAFCLRTKALATCHLKTIQFLLRCHDGHASLARETRRDPVDVDTDRASMGWTNWDLAVDEGVRVKEEKAVFKALRTPPRHVIEVDTPSPAQKKRKSNLLSSTTLSLVPNPSNATGPFASG